MIKRIINVLIIFVLLSVRAFSQDVVDINSKLEHKIFFQQQIYCLEDTSNSFTIKDVITGPFKNSFEPNKDYYPRNQHHSSTYWYKIKLNFTENIVDNPSIFEFFDQTTDNITAYIPNVNGQYIASKTGASFNFENRLFKHKNFEFFIPSQQKGVHTYYFKVSSRQAVNVIIVYRTVHYFIYYALTEYLTYGLFYGMILIFCFHNLLMFIAVKKRQYLFYVLYILSIGLFEMSTDGIAFQYIWPGAPRWNEYAYGTALYFISIFALIFTKELLHVKTKAPVLYRIINGILILRTIYFVFCLCFANSLFYYKFVEFVPLVTAFVTGITIWSRGYKPARFFVLGYTFLFLGFLSKAISVLGYNKYVPGVVGHYSLSYSFILEMVFLSFAIGDQVRLLRKEKDAAQEETLRQLSINNELKDSINQELEKKVKIRTKEVIEKSQEVFEQAHIIEQQNHSLLAINTQLELQAAEISRMNVLLEKDNIQLKDNIEKVTDARAMSTELSFEEFSAKYPDQEKCNKFLAEIKWTKGFECVKCNNTTYHEGRAPYSRRCTKCGYEESVLFNTIFQNSRIPINKAFYLLYLIYTSKGTLSSYQLSEKLSIRQSTCWQYAIKVKKVMDERKRGKRSSNLGWSKLIITPHND
ncbi:7TM diverse intracellular signaling domain-containing protein [Mucilaginibacter polytrichastri]|uniref:Chromosome partitioning protein ParA n=1 Tax=Mucilaginibacter polytrichastri TaxID=1302689 RepID=A0A1Q5ZXW5_9SPHI|nr:7TM diverse intracellular signaling domain-containing protein [Mucilaginibacter polytrichastri]OKS86606.1 hypothetical protein RG47T_2062 [Mucilaginibacter polytrichastri]SFS80811.1 7TMR-DISM extracellular 2 [Mucilaginibacter polytrichastri]